MCGKRFARKEHVENHIKLVHEKRKPYECGVCKKKFSQKHHFLSHVSNIHGIKNSPTLIPTEREIRLKVKEETEKDSDKKTPKLVKENVQAKKTNIQANKLVDKSHGPISPTLASTIRNSLTSPECKEEESPNETDSALAQDADDQPVNHPSVKYNPHVCPFCDQSFKQLPHLGAHIMSVHQPPTHEDNSTEDRASDSAHNKLISNSSISKSRRIRRKKR